ncbi:F-box domain-containing protein [Lasiosphaeria hispida]|uniref:F-box domain-containing protein n=1 Tax=Lasiosphaeria hispida TaxID=260671 RepID=A0AAJ0MH43_9PEZI|nr:F-box domain-containing protein [Lasiosphaeria hispida]
MSSQPLPITIGALPPELLDHIFLYLDNGPPSASRLHDQPTPNMLRSPEQTLKNVSLVDRKWRAIVLPILFRHAVWTFDRWDLLLVEPGQNVSPVDGIPFLRFLRDHGFDHYVDSLTMIVSNSMQGMTRKAEISRVLDAAAASSSSGSIGEGSTSAARDAKADLFVGASRFPHIADRAATYNEDNNWLWDVLFDLMNPRRITLMASPQMLASLLSRMLFVGDAWSFSRDLLHILSLSRDTKSGKEPPSESSTGTPAPQPQASSSSSSPYTTPLPQPPSSSLLPNRSRRQPQPTPSALFSVRPWKHLLLNEGSSTRVYRTYEFFLRRPPSILDALLGCGEPPNDKPLIPPHLASFSYIAIFPLSSHFNSLATFLPRVDKLFIQLVPRNNIMSNPEEMRNVQPSDLWMERNSCYSLIMRQLLTTEVRDDEDGDVDMDEDGQPVRRENNWRFLREFESGDAADRDAWEMAVQYVRMSGSNWHVEREGVFALGPRPDASTTSDVVVGGIDDNGEPEDHTLTSGAEIFQGQLERLAFNGTANLPYSPLTYAVDDTLASPWTDPALTIYPQPFAYDPSYVWSWAHGTPYYGEVDHHEAHTVYQPAWLSPQDDYEGQE